MRTTFPRLRLAAAVALATTGLGAVSASASAGDKTRINPQPRSEKPGAVIDDAKRRYCANVRGAGGFNHQECRTRAQWSSRAVEVTAAAPTAPTQVAGTHQQ